MARGLLKPGPMSRGLKMLGCAVLLTLALASAASARPLSVESITANVAAARQRWANAAARASETRGRQRALEDQIGRLKSQREPPAQALERLLRESVEADRTLTRELEEEERIEREVRGLVKAGVDTIDDALRALAPGLREGTIQDRKDAARRINQLRTARDQLRAELARLKPSSNPRSPEWAKLDVRAEPLDGPAELHEKADIVEDARDKVRGKRAALAQLLREAREERELARTARDFSTDVSLFDEESRAGRVLRRNNATSMASRAPEARDNGVAAAPEFGASFSRDSESTADPKSPAAPSNSPRLARELNPDILVSLRIDELAAGRLDIATLEALVAELERLDADLERRARSIRNRATTLEADEGHRR